MGKKVNPDQMPLFEGEDFTIDRPTLVRKREEAIIMLGQARHEHKVLADKVASSPDDPHLVQQERWAASWVSQLIDELRSYEVLLGPRQPRKDDVKTVIEYRGKAYEL